MLEDAVTADDIGALPCNHCPEKLGYAPVIGFSGNIIELGGADDLGDLGIGVFALQLVLSPGERIKNSLMAEPDGQLQISGVASNHE
ncbi:hypothetical protein D3C75_787820 [compost metagenome]